MKSRSYSLLLFTLLLWNSEREWSRALFMLHTSVSTSLRLCHVWHLNKTGQWCMTTNNATTEKWKLSFYSIFSAWLLLMTSFRIKQLTSYKTRNGNEWICFGAINTSNNTRTTILLNELRVENILFNRISNKVAFYFE